MSEKMPLGNIYVHTDDDTGMYRVGEVDGGFHTESLRSHIDKYGTADVLSHLAHMTSTVIEINKEIQMNRSVYYEEMKCDD